MQAIDIWLHQMHEWSLPSTSGWESGRLVAFGAIPMRRLPTPCIERNPWTEIDAEAVRCRRCLRLAQPDAGVLHPVQVLDENTGRAAA
jgi:hypothetical protein